jgi:integrase
MSVYRDRRSPYYQYDFQHKGRRFFGSTGQTERRAAERVEAEAREQARALMREAVVSDHRPMTVHEACERYWIEIGQHAASADDIYRHLGRIEREFGATTLISSLTTNGVAHAVGRRRMDTAQRGEVMAHVSNATVNRTLIEPLRRVLRRASRVWGQTVREIAWADLLLPEEDERIREATDEEEARILAAMREDHRPAVEFALATGCRLEEVVTLVWERVYWTAGSIEIRGKGRRGTEEKVRLIPITPEVRRILWPLRDHHPSAVFTYVARRADRATSTARGDRVPIAYEGLKTRWQRALAAAGVTDFRFHDTRHTALSRLVRATGNLKLAQKLAGHADITTTAKYAHADLDDLRRGMEQAEAARRTKSRTKSRKLGGGA